MTIRRKKEIDLREIPPSLSSEIYSDRRGIGDDEVDFSNLENRMRKFALIPYYISKLGYIEIGFENW